jgi:hypothetical protein
MKTLMETPDLAGVNKLLHYSMYQGVLYTTAKDYWNNVPCDQPGAILERIPSPARTHSLAPQDDEKSAGTSPPTYPHLQDQNPLRNAPQG